MTRAVVPLGLRHGHPTPTSVVPLGLRAVRIRFVRASVPVAMLGPTASRLSPSGRAAPVVPLGLRKLLVPPIIAPVVPVGLRALLTLVHPRLGTSESPRLPRWVTCTTLGPMASCTHVSPPDSRAAWPPPITPCFDTPHRHSCLVMVLRIAEGSRRLVRLSGLPPRMTSSNLFRTIGTMIPGRRVPRRGPLGTRGGAVCRAGAVGMGVGVGVGSRPREGIVTGIAIAIVGTEDAIGHRPRNDG